MLLHEVISSALPISLRISWEYRPMTQTPPTVTDELSARLLTALGPAALVELTAFVALANFMARSNVAMGIESQEFSAACDLKPLALASSP